MGEVKDLLCNAHFSPSYMEELACFEADLSGTNKG